MRILVTGASGQLGQEFQNNISKFGGDSDNVTIFGESAGGHNVLSLMVSKKANGLFHKAISMSGYTSSISARASAVFSLSRSLTR